MPPSATPRADRSLPLPDGRRLAYAEWGDPTGRPVLFMHRSPGSRLFDPDAEATASVRLITVDRPGYGGTDPAPDPSPSRIAADLVALAEALDLRDLALVGWSGGGQFALAAVAALAGRISSLALVVTPAPDAEIPWYPADIRSMVPALQADPVGALPGLVEAFGPMMAYPGALAAVDESPDDARVRAQPGVLDALTAMMLEAARQGAAGAAFDAVAGGRGEPLPLASVNVPTRLWYAESDPLIGPEHGRWYADRLVASTLELIPDSGHLLPLIRWGEILGNFP